MTVAELIEALKKIPGHKEVYMHVYKTDVLHREQELVIGSVKYRGADVVIEVK